MNGKLCGMDKYHPSFLTAKVQQMLIFKLATEPES
jgi:hypothetical protein